MKKAIIFALALTAFANAGYWQCYAYNDGGQTFWGTAYVKHQAAANAINSCRMNTPQWGTCWATPTCDWYY
jgi:hypothetical protein